MAEEITQTAPIAGAGGVTQNVTATQPETSGGKSAMLYVLLGLAILGIVWWKTKDSKKQ